MGRKYVLDGAILKCNKGLKPARLLVITNQKIKIQGKFKATDVDFLVPETFIRCKVKGTCIPALKKWKNTATKANLKGSQKFLYDDSYTTCVVPGSRITIVDHLQINAAGAAFEEYGNICALIPGAMPLDGFGDGTTPENGGNSFLDGLQTALDVAGLVPGFGEVADGINAAIYLGRGDYANAALSAAAMIPIGGQAATAAKLTAKAGEVAKAAAPIGGAIIGATRVGARGADTGRAVLRNSDEIAGAVKNKPLLPTEGDVGSYRELIDAGTRGDNITPHHMPSDKFMKTNGGNTYTRNDGISMNMEQPHPGRGGRHRDTATYNNNMTKAEKEAYLNSNPRDALAHDIRDARRIYREQGLYDDNIRGSLQEVIRQNKEQYPDIFGK